VRVDITVNRTCLLDRHICYVFFPSSDDAGPPHSNTVPCQRAPLYSNGVFGGTQTEVPVCSSGGSK